MRYIITTEVTCDIPEHFFKPEDVALLQMAYTMDGVDYMFTGTSADAITPGQFYDKLRAGSMPQTSQVNPDYAAEVFEGYLKQGISILHLSFSSALSGSYQSSVIAADMLSGKYPDAKLVIVDTKCASMGQGLLVYYAVKMKNEGKSLEEVAKWAEEIKLHVCHNFTVNDLFHLHRGGRVSKAAAIVGSMLGVKPVLHVNDEGRLIPIQKVRGRQQSLNALVDNMKACVGDYNNDIVFISHGDCKEEAEFVAREVKKRFGIKEAVLGTIGPIVGAHSGAGTVALFFMGEHR